MAERRVAGVVGVVGAALALGGCGGGHPASARGLSGSSSGGGAATAGIDPALVRNFRILRRPRQPGDQLPTAFVRGGPPSLVHRLAGLGLLPSLARRAVVPGTRIAEWLEPGQHGFCLAVAELSQSGAAIAGGFGRGCGRTTARLSASVGGGAFLAAGPRLEPGAPGSPALATGLVPDRVSAVELVGTNGTTTRLRLADGFFATRLAAGDRLDAVIAGQRHQIDAPLPTGGHPVARLNVR